MVQRANRPVAHRSRCRSSMVCETAKGGPSQLHSEVCAVLLMSSTDRWVAGAKGLLIVPSAFKHSSYEKRVGPIHTRVIAERTGEANKV